MSLKVWTRHTSRIDKAVEHLVEEFYERVKDPMVVLPLHNSNDEEKFENSFGVVFGPLYHLLYHLHVVLKIRIAIWERTESDGLAGVFAGDEYGRRGEQLVLLCKVVVNCFRKIFRSLGIDIDFQKLLHSWEYKCTNEELDELDLEHCVSDYIANEHDDGSRGTVICLYEDRVNNLHGNTKGNMREWLWSVFPLYWTASKRFAPHPPSHIPKSYVLSFPLVRIAEDIDWAACEPTACLSVKVKQQVIKLQNHTFKIIKCASIAILWVKCNIN